MFDLSKRVVVLTGATGNVGPTLLRAYLEQGAYVAIPVRDEAKGAALRDSLGDLAGTTCGSEFPVAQLLRDLIRGRDRCCEP